MISESNFGKSKTGKNVYKYTLENNNGMKVEILNYGGTIRSIYVPDKNCKFDDVVLGYDTIQEYEENDGYFGAIVGRNSNRIKNSKVVIKNKLYNLDSNDGVNNLHGGLVSFSNVIWDALIDNNKLVLKYLSYNGEGGFPGNLDVTVKYSLNEDNELKIEYYAHSDDDTIANFTNHSYFNLSGHCSGSMEDQFLQINADFITEADTDLTQTGKYINVADTAFDFRTPKKIGQDIESDDYQLKIAGGYDHNFVIKNNGLREVANLFEEKTGRMLRVYSDMPCMQFYSGNFLDGKRTGKGNTLYKRRGALCLETQKYPDSENIKNFPTSILKKNDKYSSVTIYKFLVC